LQPDPAVRLREARSHLKHSFSLHTAFLAVQSHFLYTAC
jgi:hypothetical protein